MDRYDGVEGDEDEDATTRSQMTRVGIPNITNIDDQAASQSGAYTFLQSTVHSEVRWITCHIV